jgi:uncharacterized membrane protein YgcG
MKHSTSKFLLLAVSVLAILGCYSESVAQNSKDKTPKAENYSINEKEVLIQKGFVNDFAEILDQPTKDKLEQTLAKFKSDSKIDFVIVTVKTTGKESAFDYSLSLANDWAVGAKNPNKAGILMLIAVEDKRWHIQITRVLEKVLTNAEVGEIGALMRPLFREKKYGEGITTSMEKLIEVLKKRRVVKTKTNRISYWTRAQNSDFHQMLRVKS